MLWPPFALKRRICETDLNCDRTFAVSMLPNERLRLGERNVGGAAAVGTNPASSTFEAEVDKLEDDVGRYHTAGA